MAHDASEYAPPHEPSEFFGHFFTPKRPRNSVTTSRCIAFEVRSPSAAPPGPRVDFQAYRAEGSPAACDSHAAAMTGTKRSDLGI